MKIRFVVPALVLAMACAAVCAPAAYAVDYRYSRVRSLVSDGNGYARQAENCRNEAERYNREAGRYSREADSYRRRGKEDLALDYQKRAARAADKAADAMRRCRNYEERAADAYRRAARSIED